MATGLPILRPFAEGIYLIGQLVCPKVGVHFMVLNYPMAVCSSCWFAVVGLWTIRLLYGRAGESLKNFGFWILDFGFFSMLFNPKSKIQNPKSEPVRLSITLLAFVPWALDVMLWDTGLWESPHAFMIFAGYLGGIGAGVLLFPAAAAMRARLANG
jgi:uncharacterized membrane protein